MPHPWLARFGGGHRREARGQGDFGGRDRGGRGFTLIEMMVVLVMIGIVTAVMISEMKGTFEEVLLRATGRELAGAFHLAYSRAVTVNQLHRVRIEPDRSRYVVEARARSMGADKGWVPVGDAPGGQGELDARISIEVRRPGGDGAANTDSARPWPVASEPGTPPSQESIAFYPDGTADAAEVILRDREGFRVALRINPTTARVRVLNAIRE